MGGAFEVDSVTPEGFGSRGIARRNTLILGAPHIGKSERIRECADGDPGIETAEILTATNERGILVVDEFDRAWQGSSTAERNAFVERLRNGNGIYAVTRPYALDWLLQSSGTGFTEACLDAFDRVLLLQYERGDERQEEGAVERCIEIGIDKDKEVSTDSGLSESMLYQELDRLSYGYEFDDGRLHDRVERYGESVVPPLVSYISLSGIDEGLLSKGVVDACSELAENFALAEFISDTKEVALEVLSGDGGQMVGAALAGSVPVGGAASLLLWAYLRDGDDTLEEREILGTLAGAGTTPTARAELEAELGLPPRTLDDLHWMLRDGGLSQVRKACEATSSDRIAEFESAMRDHGVRLDELEVTVDRLEGEVDEFVGLYSEHLRNAAKGLDVVEEQLAEDEATLLDPLVDTDEIDVDEIPYFGQDVEGDDGGASVEAVDDGRGPPGELRDLADTVHEEEMVVLKGTHGTGKTTAAYCVGRELERDGCAVRIPNLSTHSPAFVEQTLDSVEEEHIVLYVSYHIGTGPTQVDDRDLRTLREWVDKGVCDCVVVECRSELHASFQGEFGEYGDDQVKGPQLSRETFEFRPFDGYRRAIGVVLWVAEYVGVDPPDEERMEELSRLADGNPEILKIATRFEFSDEHSLADITTADELVLEDLGTLFDRSEGRREFYERLFVLLSVTGGLETAEITDLLDVDESDLKTWAEPLRGYLSREVAALLDDPSRSISGVEWQVSPDIYADATFRRSLDTDAVEDYHFWWVYEKLFTGGRERSYDAHMFDIARNLGVAYDAAVREDDEGARDRCRNTTDDFLGRTIEDAETARFVEALVPLAAEGIPFDINVLDEHFDDIVEHAGVVDRFDAGAGSVLLTISGTLYGNHIARESETATVADLAERFAVACRERYNADPAKLLENVYSIALSTLAASYTPAEADAWIETLTARANTAATDAPHDDDPALFLENVYGLALSQLAASYTPAEATEWVTAIGKFIRACAERGPHDTDSTSFLAATHAFAVAHKTPEHPGIESAWHRYLLRLFLSEGDDDHATAFYSQYHLALSQSHDIEAWLPWLVEDALDRTGVTDGDAENDTVEAAASVLGEVALRIRYDPNFPIGLDTSTGIELLGPVADLGRNDPKVFERLVERTAGTIREDEPSEWLVNRFGVEPSAQAASEFVGHAYARALAKVANFEGDLPDAFHDRAVAAARATSDPVTALLVFYSRTLPWFSADESPGSEPEIHERLFESALAAEEIDPKALYSEYLTRIRKGRSHDREWFAYLADDAITRLRTGAAFPTEEDEQLEVAVVAVSDAIHSYDRAAGMSGEIPDRVVAAVEELAAADAELFEAFASGVDERLEAEHDNLMAALEWRTTHG